VFFDGIGGDTSIPRTEAIQRLPQVFSHCTGSSALVGVLIWGLTYKTPLSSSSQRPVVPREGHDSSPWIDISACAGS